MKKKLYTTTIILLSVCLAVRAQDTEKSIRIGKITTDITYRTLGLDFNLTASGLALKCDGQLTLEFAVESDDRRLVLPVVVYSGKTRYRYERRREWLSGSYHAKPYRIYKGVKKDREYELEYSLTIPYYTWMEHASVTYREYTHDCSGDRQVSDGVLVADLNPAPVPVEPQVWRPDSTLFPSLVSFLVPEVEEIKARASLIELPIGYPVNITEVRPAFGRNAQELKRADSLLYAITGNRLLTMNGISIKGYASPEGSYRSNERLAKGRSEGFKSYLAGKYPDHAYIRNAATMWVAEDWEGLARLVEESSLPYKQEVLAVVLDGSMAPDSKEKALQSIGQWSNVYKPMLDDMFPKLRRIELRVDYTVRKFDDNEARELLYTQPELLSLDEIFRVARYYEPGSRRYREVYEIAARQYPDNVVANNNAAAALLQEGNAEGALPYLEKIKGSDVSLINYGAYHYITGDPGQAAEYFGRAKEAGVGQGEHNLNIINPR